VWPAGIEPAARRVSGDRSTVLSYGHTSIQSGQGWTRTSSLLFVRQALCAIELLARRLRDKDSNLDPRVQSAVSWPLDDPGMKISYVSSQSVLRRCCSSHSPTLRPWIAAAVGAGRASSWRRSGARRSRSLSKFAGKSGRHMNSINYRVEAGKDLSLSGGASMSLSGFFKLSITSLRWSSARLQTTKATLSDRPRFELLCRCTSSGCTPERGPVRNPSAPRSRAPAGMTGRP
jgi:hypothetical protein